MLGSNDVHDALTWVIDGKVMSTAPAHVVVKAENHFCNLSGYSIFGVSTIGRDIVICNTKNLARILNAQTPVSELSKGVKRSFVDDVSIHVE